MASVVTFVRPANLASSREDVRRFLVDLSEQSAERKYAKK